MNKEKFLKELDEIVEDKIFIGNNKQNLEEEISRNSWSISISQQLANHFTVEEIRGFFRAVITNRTDQIKKSNSKNECFFIHGLIRYQKG
ncbi:hypothetical protein KZ483_20845 [Paenibacillus sp. sptzw28]|uniref:hypothetical protein n=1 Tax=Paenibacillus sp. sptzw28 TaxID=715179 RepID=UPI001C6E1578|nr:hypothetical protein [Paenibacillus sp. sptzw28]QYR20259.1 hypothetical protein KZ483_20845 [Paenibacillus sp. sptzw28]